MLNHISSYRLLYPLYNSLKMDSIVETQRQTHEELERYEAALAEVLMQNPTVVCASLGNGYWSLTR
jgi:hypothetical protein